MITGNSSQLYFRPASTTLVLDLNPSIVTPTNPSGLFPHRIRKIHQTDMQKKTKTLKMLQNLELFELTKNQYKNQHLISPNTNSTRKNRISSYLTYKKEHQLFKSQHTTKVSYLKSKYRQRGLSSTKQSPICYRSQTLSPRNQERVSNSKLNLVKIELTDKKIKQEDKICKKQRQIYIKTSEGKRQKVNPVDYQNKILSKFTRSESRPKKEEVFFSFNEFSKTHLINEPDNNFTNKNNTSILRRKIKFQNRNSNLLAPSDDRPIQCRPWTSNKSEFQI